MYKRIVNCTDKAHFGTKIMIYMGEKDYFICVSGRDGESYGFVDSELNNYYPADTFIKNTNELSANKYELEEWCFDFNQYGYSPCPIWIKELIYSASK